MWRLIRFSENSASTNMAIDEAIFRCYREKKIDTIRFYGWKPPAVSIGRNQEIKKEVDLKKLQELDFDCVRRISGGGAVFHDTIGELTYSVVTNTDHLKTSSVEGNYNELSSLIFQPLEELGLALKFRQIHCPSVFSNGKKISGNAQARYGNIVMQHGTILVDYRPEIMYSVLKAREGRSQEKMIQSVYQHITTLSERLKLDFTPQSLANHLEEYLTQKLPQNLVYGELTSTEIKKSKELVTNKYETEEWLYSMTSSSSN
jgi:lipoate-protein ligase A